MQSFHKANNIALKAHNKKDAINKHKILSIHNVFKK